MGKGIMLYYPNMVDSDIRVYQEPTSQLKCIVFNGADDRIGEETIKGLSNRSLVLRYELGLVDGDDPDANPKLDENLYIDYLGGGYNDLEVDGKKSTFYVVVTTDNNILSEPMFDVIRHYLLMNAQEFGLLFDLRTSLWGIKYYEILSEYDYSIVRQIITELYGLLRAARKVYSVVNIKPERIQAKVDATYRKYCSVIDSDIEYDEDEDTDFPTMAEIDDGFNFDVDGDDLFEDLIQDIDQDVRYRDASRLLSDIGYLDNQSIDDDGEPYEQGVLFDEGSDEQDVEADAEVDDKLRAQASIKNLVKTMLRLSNRVYEYNKIELKVDVEDIVKIERMNKVNQQLQGLLGDYTEFVAKMYHEKPRVGMDTWTAFSDFDIDEIHWIRKIEVKDLDDLSFIEEDIQYYHRIHPVLLIDIDLNEMVDRSDDIRNLTERTFQLLSQVEHSISNALIDK